MNNADFKILIAGFPTIGGDDDWKVILPKSWMKIDLDGPTLKIDSTVLAGLEGILRECLELED